MQYIQGRGLEAVLREVATLRREGVGARAGAGAGPDRLPAGLATGLVTGRFSGPTVEHGAAEGVLPSTSEPDGARTSLAAAPGTGAATAADRPPSEPPGLGGGQPRYSEAATVAESNYRLPWAGTDRLVLAMSRQRLGQAAAARAALAEAVRWRAAQTNVRPDLAAAFERLLREAESVLNEAPPDLPADVFGR
jgi:hypothetical protein